MVKPYIDTIRGKAYFIKTITEDKYGDWDDHWATIRGEFVIHEGKKHHVYKIDSMGGHTIFSQGVDLRTMTKPIESQVEEKLRKLGYKVPRGSYRDWLYGGDQYEKFDKIIIKFLGKKVYDEMDSLARLDAYLLYKLGLGPKSAGGIVFK